MIRTEKDVVFGFAGGRELKCDLYAPAPVIQGAAGVLLLHGGYWSRGHRSAMEVFGTRLAAAGIVAVASEYRLVGESPWPAQIHDVKAAIRWMRSSAGGLGIDGTRLAVLGRSAGGHLALLAAGTPRRPEFEGDGGEPGVNPSVAAVVALFSPTVFSLREQTVRGGVPAQLLFGDRTDEQLAAAASPLTYVDASYPPTFLLHGGADEIVPPSASIVMHEALVAAGVPVELHLYAGQPHGFAGRPPFIDQCTAEIVSFLTRSLPSPS
jgi:acetyl esterase/lipase